MNRRWDFPIALVLAAAIGGVVLAAVILVLAASYEVARRNTMELARDKADLVIAAVMERTRNHLDPARAQLVYLADLIAERRIDTADRERLGDLLVASLAAVPQVSVVAYIDPDLRVLRAFRNRPGERVTLSDWSDDASVRRAVAKDERAESAYWGELFVAEDAGATFINARMPLHRGGRFMGTLIAGISIAELSEFLGMLRGDFTHNVFILSDRDFVLAHPLLVEGFPGLSDDHPLPGLNEFNDSVLSRIWSPDRRSSLEGGLSGRAEVRAVDYVGQTYVFLFQRLEGYGDKPWLVGTYLHLDDAAAQVARLGLIPQLGLGILVVALVLAIVLGGVLSRPLRRLAEAATQIRDLDLDGVSPLSHGLIREMNEAASAFNAMIGGLRCFETYVPRSLVLRLIRQNGNRELASEERDITVLFTDVVGFTSQSEDMPAPEVAAFLNRHFTLVGRCVEEEDGTIDKYIGDAVMAFWGAPEVQPDHAERACRAALAIERAIREDNARRSLSGLSPVHLRIGVHSGPALVGNIGAPDRINYTIIGDSVNAAERVEGLAREVACEDDEVIVLISDDTAARLGPGFALTAMGEHELRGRHEPIRVYRLTETPIDVPPVSARTIEVDPKAKERRELGSEITRS